MSKFTIGKILVLSATTLLGFSVLTTTIAEDNIGAINTFFGTSSYEKVEIEDGKEEDTEYYKSKYTKIDDLIKDTDDLIEDVVAEGAVLLKNENNALPLASGTKVSTYGVGSYRSTVTSSGSVFASGGCGREVGLDQGLTQAGLEVNKGIWDFYADPKLQEEYTTIRNGMMSDGPLFGKINEVPWSKVDGATTSLIGDHKVAIYNIVRISGEGNKDVNSWGTEDTYNGDSLTLSNDERDNLKGLKALKDQKKIDKIIVLLNCTATPDLDFLNDADYGVDACLQIQAVGTTGFNAIGDILTGKVNPSGKLSDTLWKHNGANPTLTNQLGYQFINDQNLELHTATKGQGGYENHYVVYQEGIYLGYKYTETRYEDVVTGRANAGDFKYSDVVAAPFGYGKSYTTFKYSDLKVTSAGDKYKVSVNVENTGERDGKDAVQVYLQKPYGDYNIKHGVESNAVNLVGFAKTKLLKKGEKETVTIEVPKRELASYDANNAKTYVLTEGDYYFSIGNGAHDATNNILAEKGFNPSSHSNMDAAGNDLLAEKFLTVNTTDAKTFSTSATGKIITNLFDDSDLNKYEETKEKSPVKYISRNDWEGTVVIDPIGDKSKYTSYTKIHLTEKMLKDFRAAYEETNLVKDDIAYPNYGIQAGLNLASMRVDEDGNEIPFDDPLWDTFMDQLTWDETVNFLSEGMRMTAAIESIGKPQTLDHNGPLGVTEPYAKKIGSLAHQAGVSVDVKPSTFPSAGTLAATMNPEIIKKVGEMHGENALWAGYSALYGPGLNIHRSQYSSRNNEYYSEDGFLTGKVSAIQVAATQSKGIYCYIKHFVLNDQETHRYGLSTWLNEQSFREIYLKAFEIAIQEGDAHAMMSSYNRVGTLVAGGKSNLLETWLREETGFEGFVVTDMYQLGAFQNLTFYLGLLKMPAGVFAGNDLVDGSITKAEQFKPYEKGYGALAWKMRTSAKRILYTTVHSAAMNGISQTTRFVKVSTWWQITLVTLDVVFALAAAASWGFFGYTYYLKNIKKEN